MTMSTDRSPFPPELDFDLEEVRRSLVLFIQGQLLDRGFSKVVLGVSGGIDSALVAVLTAQAIGPENLLALRLPYRTSSPDSLTDAAALIAQTGCRSDTVDISRMVDALLPPDAVLEVTGDPAREAAAYRLRRGNLMARARMCVLYDRSAVERALVAGTCNRTEDLLGYATIFGDAACAFSPIGDLYKSQVRALAAYVGVPQSILDKAPSADLWTGQTDESEIGATYYDLDRLLFARFERGMSVDGLEAAGFDRALAERVIRTEAANRFKLNVPPIAPVRGRPGSGF
jgi:NAD+ synthase